MLFVGKTKISELEGELSPAHTKLNVEKCARIQTKELSNARKLQIEFTIIKHYKKCLEYQDKLKEYIARAYLTCLDKDTHMVTERGFEAVIPILIELRKTLVP